MLVQLTKDYPDTLQVVSRHFPLNSHPNALTAAYAAEAAGVQGKFPEMSDLIYRSQMEWGGLDATALEDFLVQKGIELGLDGEKLRADMNLPEVRAPVDESKALAEKIGIPGTPFLFINGQPYQNSLSYEALESFIQFMQMNEKTYKACPPMVIDPQKTYTATLDTDKGKVVVRLDAKNAPLAVNSFVFLARNGWFNNTRFHRVLEGFVAQGGDPSGSGLGGPGYEFINENASAEFDREGLLAMANSGKDTNGSQFFITYAPLPNLNGGYTIFGEVTEGMDVVRQFTLRDPSQNTPLAPGTLINSIEVNEK